LASAGFEGCGQVSGAKRIDVELDSIATVAGS
jgi:hypothetical protein